MDSAISTKIRKQQDKIVGIFKSIYYIQKYLCCWKIYLVRKKITYLEKEINKLINMEYNQLSILELTNDPKLRFIYNKSSSYTSRLDNLKCRYYVN